MHPGLLIAFGLYAVVLLVVTVLAWRRTRGLDDYLLAGRQLDPGTGALSAGASDMSGWLLLGLPGAVYVSGLSASWIGIGLTCGALANWLLVAPGLRRRALELDALTLPGFVSRSLGSDRPSLRIALALVILFFFTVYVAAGLVAGAKLFETVLGLDYVTALVLGSVVIVLYTVAGGFLAVAWTDAVQALLMMAALLLLPVLALMAGARPPVERLALFTADMSMLGFVSLVAWGLGYFGQPHILTRFMALGSDAAVSRARSIAMSWMVTCLVGAVGVGLTGSVMFGTELTDPETVLLAMTETLLNPWIAGLVLCAVLAAIMSTVDSQLLVAGSALAEDLGDLIGLRTPAARMQGARAAVVALALVALGIATDPDSSVLGLVSFAWAGLGGTIGPVVLLVLYRRDQTPAGISAGLIAGAVTMIAWHPLQGGLFELYEIVPGFLVTWLVSRSVSAVTAAPVSSR